NLITTHQTHQCHPYCAFKDGRPGCRFGYPTPLVADTSFNNDTGRYVYARGPGDERINCYNPDLLRFGGSNMNL
ncbi:hypothetical protein F5H01DRAFT_259223, partial [Linnemannia elongata]